MKKTAPQKIRLGIFIVLGTLLLVTALYFIGNRQNLFSNNITLNATFSNVNGLQQGNNVRFSGIVVGTVNKIEMTSDTVVIIQMLIKEDVSKHIRKNAIATIGSDGLVGNMIVNIIPREGDALPVTSGDTIKSYSRIGTDDMLTTLNVTNENAALLTADLLKITNYILKGKGTLGMLINDSILAKDLKYTIFNLKETSKQAASAMRELNEMMNSLDSNESVAGLLLTDSVMGRKLKKIVQNLENSSEEIGTVTRNLDSIISEIKTGKGAVSYLSQDETLVRNIDTTMINIKESSRKFNENMDALKNNILFRGYFKKQERQQRKDSIKAARNH
jgi:phospholipid/cholesterol/gamma-HCH transport system substrate-binding protein